MELKSWKHGYRVDICPGEDAYYEVSNPAKTPNEFDVESVFIDDWDSLPLHVQIELEGIQRELEFRLERCADLILKHRSLDPTLRDKGSH